MHITRLSVSSSNVDIGGGQMTDDDCVSDPVSDIDNRYWIIG